MGKKLSLAHLPTPLEPVPALSGLCSAAVGAFVEEVQRSYRWRAKRLLGLRSVQLAHHGTVTFIQRFDFERAVGGDDRRPSLVALADDLVEVERLVAGQPSESEVVDDQQVDAAVASQPTLVRAVATTRAQIRQQLVRGREEHLVTRDAGTMADRLRDVALADAGLADEAHVLVLADEGAGGEVDDLVLGDLGVEAEVEVLERFVVLEAGAAC